MFIPVSMFVMEKTVKLTQKIFFPLWRKTVNWNDFCVCLESKHVACEYSMFSLKIKGYYFKPPRGQNNLVKISIQLGQGRDSNILTTLPNNEGTGAHTEGRDCVFFTQRMCALKPQEDEVRQHCPCIVKNPKCTLRARTVVDFFLKPVVFQVIK